MVVEGTYPPICSVVDGVALALIEEVLEEALLHTGTHTSLHEAVQHRRAKFLACGSG